MEIHSEGGSWNPIQQYIPEQSGGGVRVFVVHRSIAHQNNLVVVSEASEASSDSESAPLGEGNGCVVVRESMVLLL